MISAEHADGSLSQWVEGIRGELTQPRFSWPLLLRSITKRKRIAIVTDSACAIPPEIRQIPGTEHLRIVPLPVMVDGQIYTDGDDGPGAELPIALATGKRVQTSRPAPGRFRDVFADLQKAGYQHIIAIHLSGKLSGTADAARLAANAVDIPVTVLDTQAAAMAEGYMVLDALLMNALGYEPEDIVETLEKECPQHGVFFTVANLEALTKGGRISALSGLLGTILNVKPVLYLQDGTIQLAEKTRSYERALERVSTMTEAACADGNYRIAIHYFGDRKPAESLVPALTKLSSIPVPVLPLPAVLAAHTGLGSIGVSYSPHIDRHPLR